jgi:hypothetical protein
MTIQIPCLVTLKYFRLNNLSLTIVLSLCIIITFVSCRHPLYISGKQMQKEILFVS